MWQKRTQNDDSLDDINFRLIGKHIYFNAKLEKKDKVLHTIAGKQDSNCAFHKPSFLSDKERIYGSTFPEDFNFFKKNVLYICGMSVPPVMMAQVAT